MASAVSITPYMMMPGDAKVVSGAIYDALSKPPRFSACAAAEGEPAPWLPGNGSCASTSTEAPRTYDLILEQQGTKLEGTHRGEFVSGDLRGADCAESGALQSSQKIQGTRLFYDFTGTADGEKMAGNVNLGEYGEARWSAERHSIKRPKA